MDKEKELRCAIEEEFGAIRLWEKIAPGICYAAAQRAGEPCTTELYVLEAGNPIVSETAKQYAIPLEHHSQYLTYAADLTDSGKTILEYEAYRYLMANHMPLPKGADLRDTATYGREHHPEYFGDYPVPLSTPLGVTLRYVTLMPGVFLLETDQLRKGIAVCYPISACDLSDFVAAKAEKTGAGLPETHRYLFFPEETACLALYELSHSYQELRKSEWIDMDAVMNAVRQRFPNYAAANGDREQNQEPSREKNREPGRERNQEPSREQAVFDRAGAFRIPDGDPPGRRTPPEQLPPVTEDRSPDYLKF